MSVDFQLLFTITIIVLSIVVLIMNQRYLNSEKYLADKGWNSLRKKDFEGALQHFDMAIEKNPQFAFAYRGRAIIRQYYKDYDGAIADCQKAIDLEPAKIHELLLTRGVSYNDLGKAGEAISDLTRFIQANPNETSMLAYRTRADAYQKLNRFEEALADLDYVINDLGWKDFAVFSERGLVHRELKNYDAAIEDFKAILQYDIPKSLRFNTHLLLVGSYKRTRRYDEGLDVASRMIEEEPESDLSYFNRGQMYLDKGEYEKGLADFQQALQIKPDTAYYEPIAMCYAETRRYTEALEAINQFIPAYPDHAQGYRIRGFSHMGLGNQTKALEDFHHYLEKHPNDAIVYNNCAWLKSALGSYSEALIDANKAIELDPDFAIFYDTRGQASWLLGDYESALTDYEAAYHLDSDHVGIKVSRVVALCSLGRTDEAIAIWQQIQARDDGLTTAQALQEKYHYAQPFYEAMQHVETLAKSK